MNKEKQEIISVSQHTDFRMVCELFRQLSDETRIRIFWILCHREECVQEIAALMEMSSAAISHHLRRLRACALIVSRREGKEVYYRAADTKEARFLHQMIEDLLDITCPQEDRFAIMASEAYQAIIDSGINLNSNIGAQIQAFNKFYQNSIKDFNVFKAVPQILGASKVRYTKTDGSGNGTLEIESGVKAICGHQVATTRATDYSVGTRVVLSTEESKTNIIPLYRWAVKTLRPWFIVVIGTAAFLASYKAAVAPSG